MTLPSVKNSQNWPIHISPWTTLPNNHLSTYQIKSRHHWYRHYSGRVLIVFRALFGHTVRSPDFCLALKTAWSAYIAKEDYNHAQLSLNHTRALSICWPLHLLRAWRMYLHQSAQISQCEFGTLDSKNLCILKERRTKLCTASLTTKMALFWQLQTTKRRFVFMTPKCGKFTSK